MSDTKKTMNGTATDDTKGPNDHTWPKSILITFLIAGTIEIFLFLVEKYCMGSRESNPTPVTFHTLWEISALLIIFNIVRKFGISKAAYVVTLLFSLFLVAIFRPLIPDKFNLIEARYYGVESRKSLVKHDISRMAEDNQYNDPLIIDFSYRTDDPRLQQRVFEDRQKYEYVNTKEFLFWQTGFAFGFYPYDIEEHYIFGGFWDRVGLFFSVGPLVIAECFVKGIFRSFFILFFAQLIYFVIKRDHIWWHFSDG